MSKRTCTACNGSGHYDAENSPSCSACGGTGKEDEPKRVKKEVTQKRELRKILMTDNPQLTVLDLAFVREMSPAAVTVLLTALKHVGEIEKIEKEIENR